MQAVILDTGVLSLAVDKPGKNSTVTAVQNWLTSLLTSSVKIYVPEICDYELRRELIRAQKVSSLRRLDILVSGAEYIAITTPIMRHAAQLWAASRNIGKPTSDDTALDGDIILCAQVHSLAIGHGDYMVATTNAKHLNSFVSADEWQNITS